MIKDGVKSNYRYDESVGIEKHYDMPNMVHVKVMYALMGINVFQSVLLFIAYLN